MHSTFFGQSRFQIPPVGSPLAEEAVEVECFVARAAVELKGLGWLRLARYPPGEDNMVHSLPNDSGGTVRVPPRSQNTDQEEVKTTSSKFAIKVVQSFEVASIFI